MVIGIVREWEAEEGGHTMPVFVIIRPDGSIQETRDKLRPEVYVSYDDAKFVCENIYGTGYRVMEMYLDRCGAGGEAR
jgi:hypothetical protein